MRDWQPNDEAENSDLQHEKEDGEESVKDGHPQPGVAASASDEHHGGKAATARNHEPASPRPGTASEETPGREAQGDVEAESLDVTSASSVGIDDGPVDDASSAEPDDATTASSAEPDERALEAGVRLEVGLAMDSDIIGTKNESRHYGEAVDSTPIGFDEVQDSEADLFEPPAEFESVRHKVQSGELPVIVLAVPEGGRSTSALALVKSCHSLKPRRIGPRSRPMVEAKHLALYPSRAWLMDLTDPDEEFEWDKLLEHLAGLSQDVRQQGSVLIVIANKDVVSSPNIRTYGIVQELKSPDAYGVFERKLSKAIEKEQRKVASETATHEKSEADSPAAAEEKHEAVSETAAVWTQFFRGRGQLDGEQPGVALRLCKAVIDARNYWASLNLPEQKALKDRFVESRRAAPGATDAQIVQLLALDRFQTWEDELDQWNAQHETESRLKTFQVAAAILPSGDPKRVRDAATALLESIEGKRTEDLGLRGPGTRLLVTKSMAVLTNGRISFPRPGFSEAVVRYFWEDWPEYRKQFLAWMMGLANNTDTGVADKQTVKDNIADFALHHAQQRGEFEFLNEVITKWAESDSMPDAVRLLERAATASGISSKVRTNTLQWLSQASAARKRVVAELCASEKFAPNHPRLVMTRLSHLMNDADAPKETLAKACRLLVAESGQAEKVLDWLKTHANGDESSRQRASQLYLELAAITLDSDQVPVLLKESKASDKMRSNVVACWAGVFRNVTVDDASDTFHKWMECCSQPALADQVLTLFHDGLRHTHMEEYKAAQNVDMLMRDWSKATSLPDELRLTIEGKLAMITRDIRASTYENPVAPVAEKNSE